MKNTNFLYNNEAIGLIAFWAIIKEMKRIECSKSFLILPLMLHDEIIEYTKRKRAKILSIKNLQINLIDHFSCFNERYYSFITLTMNVLTIAEELKMIELIDDEVIFKEDFNLDINKVKKSQRAKRIIEISPKIASILKEPVEHLYFSLRIQV